MRYAVLILLLCSVAPAQQLSTPGSDPVAIQQQYHQAAAALAQGKYKIAEDILNQIFDSTQDPTAMVGLSEVYIAQGDSTRAIKLLEGELARTPDKPEYLIGLGNLYFRLQKFAEAADTFKRASKVRLNSDTMMRLAESLRRTGDATSARQALEKSAELEPKNTRAKFALAVFLDTEGHKAAARPIYEEILKLEPDNAVAQNNLAFMLADLGENLDRALELAKQARTKAGNDPNVGDTLGYVLLKRKQTDEALALFRSLLRDAPANSGIRYHLGLALIDKGDKFQAKAELESALRFAKEKAEIDQIQAAIDGLK